MTQKFDPAADNRRWMLYVVFVIIAAWIGLWGVVQTDVNASTVTLFFILLFVAVTSTVMPAMAYLNARFGKVQAPGIYRLRFIRQSVWVGICTVVIAWLQTRRVLSLMLGMVLIGVFALVETFLITRESPAAP